MSVSSTLQLLSALVLTAGAGFVGWVVADTFVPAGSRLEPARPRPSRSPSVALGAGVRRVFRLPPAVPPDQLLGRSAFVCPLVLLHPALPVLALVVVWTSPLIARRRADRARRQAENDAVPEVAAVLALAVRSGSNVQNGIDVVAQRVPGIGGESFAKMSRQLAAGALLADVLADLPQHLGEAARPLSRAIGAGVSSGGELVPALDRVARELRERQHQQRLEAAQRLPVLLLFPLVTCILPAFALLTVIPLLVSSIAQLFGGDL